MAGPTLPNMSLVCPALDGDSGTWDDELNTLLVLIDSHTHEPGKGVLVPTAGLNINADLSLAGNGLTNIKSLAFSEIAALAAGSDVIFVSSSDHELYWRSHSGVNVKLTSGNALNVAAFAGGIGGDYSAVGAALDYDAANTRYTFQGAAPTFDWAALASGDLHLYQEGTTESVYVGLKAPAGLAASYDLTWPTALPGARTPLYLDQTGQISNTPRPMVKVIHAATGQVNPNIANSPVFSQNTSWNFPSNLTPGVVVYPITLDVDAVITGFSVYMNKGSDNTKTVQASLVSAVRATRTVINTVSNSDNAPGPIVLIATGLNTQIADDGTQYSIEVQGPTSSAADSSYNVMLTYTEAPY